MVTRVPSPVFSMARLGPAGPDRLAEVSVGEPGTDELHRHQVRSVPIWHIRWTVAVPGGFGG